MSNGKKWALVLGVVCAMGLVILVILETSRTHEARGNAPGPGPNLSEIVSARDPARELVEQWYRSYHLGWDYSGAWDMMTEEMQKSHTPFGKEHYLESWKNHKPRPVPEGGIQIEAYPPEDDWYTFLVRASGRDPMVIVVIRVEDGYKVHDYRDWKGERLP